MKKYCTTFLLSFIVCTLVSAQKVEDARTVIQAAQKKAKQQNKKIFLKFTASWCGWCHKMDDAMKDASTEKLFTDHYIITYIAVEETPKNKNLENAGGADLMKKYGGEKQGLPYWVVLDENGKMLANSKVKAEDVSLDADGDNAGCPAENSEIDYFIRVLKSTSTLTTDDLEIIKKRFQKIKTN